MSSSAPGPSPTKRMSASGLPSPNTIWVRPAESGQRVQSPSRARTSSSVGARSHERALEQPALRSPRWREPGRAGGARSPASRARLADRPRPIASTPSSSHSPSQARADASAARSSSRSARSSRLLPRRGCSRSATPARGARLAAGREARRRLAGARAACPCRASIVAVAILSGSSPSPRTRSRGRSRRRGTRRRSAGSRTSRTCRRAPRIVPRLRASAPTWSPPGPWHDSQPTPRERRAARPRRPRWKPPGLPKPVVWQLRHSASPALPLAASVASALRVRLRRPTSRARRRGSSGTPRSRRRRPPSAADRLAVRARAPRAASARSSGESARMRAFAACETCGQERRVLEAERVLRVVAARGSRSRSRGLARSRARGAGRRGRGRSRSRRSRAPGRASRDLIAAGLVRSRRRGSPRTRRRRRRRAAPACRRRVRVLGELPGLVLRLRGRRRTPRPAVARRVQEHRHGRPGELGQPHAQQRRVGFAAQPSCDARSGPRGRSARDRARPRSRRRRCGSWSPSSKSTGKKSRPSLAQLAATASVRPVSSRPTRSGRLASGSSASAFFRNPSASWQCGQVWRKKIRITGLAARRGEIEALRPVERGRP